MRVKELQLMNYRNYQQLHLLPDQGLCVLTGDNAQGKTNVLEAIFLCALGRSHRTPRDAELIRDGQEYGMAALTLETGGGTRTISCKLSSKDRKRILIDGAQLTRSGELMGCLNVVMFAPEDLMLVKGGPGERRRFLDMEISQMKPAYYYALQRYNEALKQRNALLKLDDPGVMAMLDPWDEQLARVGAQIMRSRSRFMQELSAIAAQVHLRLSGNTEVLELVYHPNVPDGDLDGLEQLLHERLVETREKDIFRGSTSVGPHRDDIDMILGGTDVRVYGSQGQQRTVVLSLKLSELEMMRQLRGEPPVLLLDDVFSELDRNRQRMLLEAVQGCQTFITCTHLEELEEAGMPDGDYYGDELQMQVYYVSDGSVTEV